MQTPDVLHVEAHLPERTWFQVGETIELMCLHEVFGGDGRPWDASGAEPEIYVEARG